MNNKYVPDISVYSRPFAVKSFIRLNRVFFGVNLRLKNFVSWCLRGNEQKMQNEPNLRQITHFNNEQRTMNYEKFQTNPIYNVIRPKTMITKKNEPNSNPILPAIVSIYAIACALGVKYLGVLCALCGYEKKCQTNPILEKFWVRVPYCCQCGGKKGYFLLLSAD